MQHTHKHTGFSLIEILVVISIITLLLGIGVVAMNGFYASARRTEASQLLQVAANAETEYRAKTGTTINQEGSSPIDWNNAKAYNAPGYSGSANISGTYEDIERFVWAIQQVSDAEKILRIQSDYLKDTDDNGFLELVDPWDIPMRYRQKSEGTDLPAHHMPFLATAGTDETWGTPGDDDEADNMYSYEMD